MKLSVPPIHRPGKNLVHIFRHQWGKCGGAPFYWNKNETGNNWSVSR